jgi:hypothetical protein
MRDLETVRVIKRLIESVLVKKMAVSAFCEEFERIYNFELEKEKLSKKEKIVLGKLFDKVVYYSSFPEELEKIPHYVSDQEIIESVKVAWSALQQ